MTPDIWVALIQWGVKFGIDSAIAIATALKNPNGTIDDAIAALQLAKTKTAADYLAEASASNIVVEGTPTP